MNQAQEIRLMMQKAQNTCPEGSIEQSDCIFEIELLGNLYRLDRFKEDISPLTRLLYKERRTILSLEESLAFMKQTHEIIEQKILSLLKTE